MQIQSRELKYVIFPGERAVLIAPSLNHSDVINPYGSKPTSAGICRITTRGDKFEVNCHGKSVSLKLNSDPETDSDILTKTLNEFQFS